MVGRCGSTPTCLARTRGRTGRERSSRLRHLGRRIVSGASAVESSRHRHEPSAMDEEHHDRGRDRECSERELLRQQPEGVAPVDFGLYPELSPAR
jgi:hypothetical protein